MAKKSLADAAYEVLTEAYNQGEKSAIPFVQICEGVCEKLEISEGEFLKIASRFYTDLTLDGRFVVKENNTWTLREHELYKNVHIDMNDAYSYDEKTESSKDDEESDENINEDEETNEYEEDSELGYDEEEMTEEEE